MILPAAKPTGLVDTNFLSSKKMRLMEVLNLLTTNRWAPIDGSSSSNNEPISPKILK